MTDGPQTPIPSPSPPFELDRLIDYSDGALIAELRRVAALVLEPVMIIEAYEKLAKASRTTLVRRFGSWEAALKAAGLTERVNPNLLKLSDDEVLEALRKLASQLGRENLTVDDVSRNLPFGGDRLRRRWGSARKAFEAAGLSATALGKRFSDDECFENMLEIWTHYGRAPTYREMSVAPSKVGAKAYKVRFGSWNRALAAFVERANADTPLEATRATDEEHRKSKSAKASRNPRDVPLGLRFKVLRRDRFRCVLCGDSPPHNPQCVLHVDHIKPWSMGGETAIENLRALCSTCNVGRSNRFSD